MTHQRGVGSSQWLVKNLGQAQTDQFLKLPITQTQFKLPFHNTHSFLQRVDELLHRPAWSCTKVTMCESLQEEVELLIMQKILPKGAMIAPIILASDKHSWPVYMSIGNIAKAKRHQASAQATVLIGYLPAGKLDCFTPEARSLARYRLFHHCMSLLLQPLVAARSDGVEMCVYPILAAYVANFPEQCLVACCKENLCPKCLVAVDERGDGLDSAMCDPESTKDVLQRHKNGQHPPEFEENCLCAIYKPFWANMPHANIFLVFTPDLLHQVHKGVFKDHLIKWCLQIIGEEEMDACFKAIPDYPGLCHFKKGISTVKQWTGREHKKMQWVFIALLASAVPSCVLVVAQSILDFSYYAQLQIHTADSLEALHTTLAVFHTNKHILKDLTICEHFNIPKLHQLSHYVQSITLFGAADSFNTELPERLHIDFAKDAYFSYDSDSDSTLEGIEAATPHAIPTN
ncbi:hypothetical protein BDR07DRAFT_1454604 [Suillus spraguei]|nr:hypothetical protein BDR07DRAFT_1454604 [Suillus spraguei]